MERDLYAESRIGIRKRPLFSEYLSSDSGNSVYAKSVGLNWRSHFFAG